MYISQPSLSPSLTRPLCVTLDNTVHVVGLCTLATVVCRILPLCVCVLGYVVMVVAVLSDGKTRL